MRTAYGWSWPRFVGVDVEVGRPGGWPAGCPRRSRRPRRAVVCRPPSESPRRDSPKVLARWGACLTGELLAKPGSCFGRCGVLGGWVTVVDGDTLSLIHISEPT